MTMKSLCTKLVACTTLAFAASAAQAVVYNFSLTGDYTASWSIDTANTPDDFASGTAFVYWDVAGFPDALFGEADVYFYSGSIGGGLAIEDFYGDTVLVVTDGPQLYTGTEDAPVFLTGSFNLTEYQGPGTYTLTISAVPEPAAIALMLAGLGVVGVAARRRKGREEGLAA